MRGPTLAPTIAAIYDDKPAGYFANARLDIVERLSTGPGSAILELGCGAGGTGRATLAAGKAGRYVGLELSESAAKIAQQDLTEVIVGDVAAVDLTPFASSFDALIVSEVLEHLTDPWSVICGLVSCLKPGAMVYASSPNVAHWSVIRGLLNGRFEYRAVGVMDRTHLRWFTPRSYRELFQEAGVEVLELVPVTPLRPKARMINALTGGRFWYLFATQIMVVGRKAS